MKWVLLILLALSLMTISPYRPVIRVKPFNPCFRAPTEIESRFVAENAGTSTGVSYVIPCDWNATEWLAALRGEEAALK